jgi:hypothetical protein
MVATTSSNVVNITMVKVELLKHLPTSDNTVFSSSTATFNLFFFSGIK